MFARCLVFYSCMFLVVSQQCYWNTKCTYSYFGSKTVYDDVRGDIRDVPELEGCDPVGVWALMRHGTRHPTAPNVASMKRASELKDAIVAKNLLERRGELCAQDITNLQIWLWDEAIETSPGFLAKNGYQEIYDLGYRFHQKFSSLLQDLGRYQFRPTLEQRTMKSAEAFLEGLNQGQWMFKNSNATDRDDVLRPYYYCTKHNVEVYYGQRSSDEMDKYSKSSEFQKMLQRVQKRSGLDKPLTPTNVSGLYDLCRYGRALSPTKTSPWCALFTDQDLVILEYQNDIRHYFRNGYGSTINGQLGAPPLKDLFENFFSIVSGANSSFTGYFSHDSLIQMSYTALHLFKDYPEISGFERIGDRKWRTSYMTPFAGNFVAVLHRCPKWKTSNHYQVQFFINEKEFHLCNARTCSWDQFNEKFAQFVESNLDICNIDKRPIVNRDTSKPEP